MLPTIYNRTHSSCHISYMLREDNKQFPLHIIQKVEALNRVLHKIGFERYNFSVCGQYIRIQGTETYNVRPYCSPGPFKENMVTRMNEDKRLVMALMCLIILLENEGYIYAVNVGGIDETGSIRFSQENRELWENAWSIFITMNGGEYERQSICKVEK